MTPYYQESGITIYHGDAREILPSISESNCVITDPPYGFHHYEHDDDRGVAESLNPYVRKAVFGYPETLCRWCRLLGEPDEWVTWWPTNKFGARSGKKLPRTSEAIAIWGVLHEMPRRPRTADDSSVRIALASGRIAINEDGTHVEDTVDGDVWRDPAPGIAFNSHQRLHPNEKPYSLMCKIVRLCTAPGETVLDPFAGSGTTLLAAKNLHRKAIGIEIEEKYCEIAANRLRQSVLNFDAGAGPDLSLEIQDVEKHGAFCSMK